MPHPERAPVAVAMSGGVDSLRAAVMLREAGHEVFGLHMRHLPGPEAEAAIREKAVSALAARFSIPLHVVDLRKRFEAEVVAPFVSAYARGLTPNPCVLCNPRVKFGALRAEALRMGAGFLATGHYARIAPPAAAGGAFGLLCALDAAKDQSYFLFGLTQEMLAHTLFPLGKTTKAEVLAWARAALPEALFPAESQDICFIARGGFRAFLDGRLPGGAGAGDFIDPEGRAIGRHRGLHAYTVGQRRGLGLPSSEPWYVTALDEGKNAVFVGRRGDLSASGCEVLDVNWMGATPPEGAFRARVRIRNAHRPAPALVSPAPGGGARVVFETPQRAVTPGQAAVFYEGLQVLGGGTIAREAGAP